MADVFLAVVGGEPLVVKRLRAELADDPTLLALLRDEARVTARAHHPNVVGAYGMADDAFVMEYVDGQSLLDVLRRAAARSVRVSPEMVYLAIADVLAGLHRAHEAAGIVHRDVTPHNVMVTYDGSVKLLDFGIAAEAPRGRGLRPDAPRMVQGKVRYMAPEQAAGAIVDRRADLFPAGIMVWEAATGRRFWDGANDGAVIHALVEGRYSASPRAVLGAQVPEAIDAICRRALTSSPAARYRTAAAMRKDLLAAIGGPSVIDGVRRELAALVSGLFAAERAAMAQLLERSRRGEVTPIVLPTSVVDAPTLTCAITRTLPSAASRRAPPRVVER
jgi:serine/threonine-protein kinase